jgi:uncharacterized protein YprB with RNaseH-like and TPR domain
MKKWSLDDEEVLKTAYPYLGYKVCDLFPDRTASAVLRKAERMRLKVDRKFRDFFYDDRCGYLDIECSNLNANFGVCFSWCIKEQGTDHMDFSVVTKKEMQDGTLDKRVIEDLIKTLKEYTVIYTYYGSRFDVPFLRTRALMYELEFPPIGEILHRDLYYLVRSRLKLNRNSLDVACGALGIEGKTHINWKYWIRAMTGDKESLDYIFDHNKYDVLILERLHERLAKFEQSSRRYL